MKTTYIENLIVKFMTKSISAKELDQLSKWIEVKENEKYFFEFVKINYALDLNFATYSKETAKNKFLKNIDLNSKSYKKRKNISFWKYGVAASIALLLSITYYFNTKKDEIIIINPIVNQESSIKIGTDKATLTLDDGATITLEKGTDFKTTNAESNGEKIVYKKLEEETIPEIAYNYLTIPRGGQFFVELFDNTKVWLNSESQLKYPVAFIEGETRKVELLYGEAYFEVSPSTKNHGASFIVKSKMQQIEVLGTGFNVKAYQDETLAYTTLVEGKVAIEANNTKEILKPNQQAVLNLNKQNIQISSVDVYNEISWKDGVFSFDQMSLKKIMIVLSRWYDIDVRFENKEIENTKFNGILRKNQPLESILNTIKNTNNINYKIDDKTITFS